MAKPRATGADARLIGITEVTYGTAPSDGYFVLPFKSTDLDKETPLGDDPLLGQGRAAQGAYYDRPSVSGGFEIPLDIQSAGFWLHGLLGAPTTTGTNPYTHVFTAGGNTPSKTLEVGHTQLATPSYRRYLGVNLNDFSFSLSPRGVASARVNVVAQSRVIAATSIDATPAVTYAVTRFSQGNGLIKVGGTQVAYVTAGDFNFTNFAGRGRDHPRRRADRRRRHGAGPSVRLDDRALVRSCDADHAADRLRQPDAGGAAVRLYASGRLVADCSICRGCCWRLRRRRSPGPAASSSKSPGRRKTTAPPATGCG